MQASSDELERRIPVAVHAARPKPGGEVDVGDSLASVGVVRSGQRLDERGRHRLDLVVAPLAQQGVLDVAKAGEVGRVFLEDGLVPEQGAGRVAAPQAVDVREPLVRLAPDDPGPDVLFASSRSWSTRPVASPPSSAARSRVRRKSGISSPAVSATRSMPIVSPARSYAWATSRCRSVRDVPSSGRLVPPSTAPGRRARREASSRRARAARGRSGTGDERRRLARRSRPGRCTR